MQTILIADDEIAFLDILQVILHRYGYFTITAPNGLRALELIRTHVPQMIFLDDMMPGMNGGDVCLAVKNDLNLSHIPVVLFSAGARIRDPIFIQQIRADGALMKPFHPDEVLNIVNRCLRTLV
ncbi:MAG TPA: response regulator [Phototrophicaceae bacterium]|nr:response regulator [Phototrophicaceae bacterium]